MKDKKFGTNRMELYVIVKNIRHFFLHILNNSMIVRFMKLLSPPKSSDLIPVYFFLKGYKKGNVAQNSDKGFDSAPAFKKMNE